MKIESYVLISVRFYSSCLQTSYLFSLICVSHCYIKLIYIFKLNTDNISHNKLCHIYIYNLKHIWESSFQTSFIVHGKTDNIVHYVLLLFGLFYMWIIKTKVAFSVASKQTLDVICTNWIVILKKKHWIVF